MHIDLSQDRLQSMAKTLRRELGDAVDHRAMLDALAKSLGYKSYGALKGQLPKSASQRASEAAPENPASQTPESWDEMQARLHADPVWHDFTERLSQGIRGDAQPADDGRATQVVYAVTDDGPTARLLRANGEIVREISGSEPVAGPEDLSDLAHAYNLALKLAAERGIDPDRITAADDHIRHDDDTGMPRYLEVTFTPPVKACGVTVALEVSSPEELIERLRHIQGEMSARVNAAFDRIGDLRLPDAGTYGLYVQLGDPSPVAEIYET